MYIWGVDKNSRQARWGKDYYGFMHYHCQLFKSYVWDNNLFLFYFLNKQNLKPLDLKVVKKILLTEYFTDFGGVWISQSYFLLDDVLQRHQRHGIQSWWRSAVRQICIIYRLFINIRSPVLGDCNSHNRPMQGHVNISFRNSPLT